MPARWLRTVCRSDSESSAIPLELEQVVERLSRVVAARCRRFALDGGARREEGAGVAGVLRRDRSEEHTSELQSLTNLVWRPLLEKNIARLLSSITTSVSKCISR